MPAWAKKTPAHPNIKVVYEKYIQAKYYRPNKT